MIRSRLTRLLLITIVSGCAANSHSAVDPPEPEPACSFRSPTTCWSVGGRFPAKTTSRKQPQDILADSTLLASAADTTARDMKTHREDHMQ
jgi:hypothetical protein